MRILRKISTVHASPGESVQHTLTECMVWTMPSEKILKIYPESGSNFDLMKFSTAVLGTCTVSKSPADSWTPGK